MYIPALQNTTILLHEAIIHGFTYEFQASCQQTKVSDDKRQHILLIKNKSYNLKARRLGCRPIKTPMNSSH